MRLAFDLDGVLADLEGALRREATRLFGTAPVPRASTPAPPASGELLAEEGTGPVESALAALSLTPRQNRTLWREIKQTPNFWETLSELEPGAVRRLGRLVRQRRWELLFITSRPDAIGESVQVQSQRWLEAQGFVLPSVFVLNGSRGKLAHALQLDLVVDDRPENCLDVVLESKARAILVRRGDAVEAPANARRLGIAEVPGVGAVLDILEKADEADGTGGTLMERVKRLLGLKTTPDAQPTG